MANIVSRLWKRLHKGEDSSPENPEEKEHWSDRMDGFSQTVDDVLQSDPATLGDPVHVISLTAFKEVVGDAWDHLAPKVQLMSENTLLSYLDPSDIYRQPAEDLFLLAFPTKKPDMARMRAREITIDLGNRLMGSHFSLGGEEEGGALVHAAEVPTEEAFGADGEVNLEVIQASVAATRAAEKTPPPVPAAAAALMAEMGVFNEGSNVVHARYRPIWDSPSERIVGYRCVPFREVEGRKVSDGAFYPANAGVDFLVSLDRDLLGMVAETYAQAVAQGADVVVPIHAMTVLTAGREVIGESLRAIPAHCSRQHLIFEAIGARDETLARDVIAALKLEGGGVAIRLSLESPDPLVLLRAGADRVGAMWTEGVVRRKLHQVAQGSPALHAYLWNMPDRKAVAASLKFGIQQVEGPGVAPVVLKAPGRTGPMSRSKIILS
ncbi:hypothetical protein [Magnetospira sp. QH-2]|uniref:hypothetical protein n=1 Tax=Magnetospira sp. (strain QH-2) TaxID=1288970 RepID=UPI0003E81031|nr:hypothetical protein [Magnetospira sp. QH-2]CCQ73495.1 Protein of unknown function [Magnetospira sp. QH-2]